MSIFETKMRDAEFQRLLSALSVFSFSIIEKEKLNEKIVSINNCSLFKLNKTFSNLPNEKIIETLLTGIDYRFHENVKLPYWNEYSYLCVNKNLIKDKIFVTFYSFKILRLSVIYDIKTNNMFDIIPSESIGKEDYESSLNYLLKKDFKRKHFSKEMFKEYHYSMNYLRGGLTFYFPKYFSESDIREFLYSVKMNDLFLLREEETLRNMVEIKKENLGNILYITVKSQTKTIHFEVAPKHYTNQLPVLGNTDNILIEYLHKNKIFDLDDRVKVLTALSD